MSIIQIWKIYNQKSISHSHNFDLKLLVIFKFHQDLTNFNIKQINLQFARLYEYFFSLANSLFK